MSVILSVEIIKCQHSDGVYNVDSYPCNISMLELFNRHHQVEIVNENIVPEVKCPKGRNLSLKLTLNDLQKFNITEIRFICKEPLSKDVIKEVKKQEINAFEQMMKAVNVISWPKKKEQR